ncbi:unnamed protein product [Enterobius vermicularis]|uniref:Reverse transcriptase domain-containing protein n=1 Tax=Enterobius vermicularis TaxID=51028 RepID=A0A0N4V8U2_ENTVE|nr:unnamed protein product [Enterobius vermicularis]
MNRARTERTCKENVLLTLLPDVTMMIQKNSEALKGKTEWQYTVDGIDSGKRIGSGRRLINENKSARYYVTGRIGGGASSDGAGSGGGGGGGARGGARGVVGVKMMAVMVLMVKN